MEQVRLEANLRSREETGKKHAKRLRRAGGVPAVVYKAGRQTLGIAVNHGEFLKAMHTSAGENVIIELKIAGASGGAESKTVIVKDIQQHPFKDNVLHVDFGEISLHEAIKVKVPIAVKGEALGVKSGDGVLEHILWELEIECLPARIPEKIEVDVAAMEIGHAKQVKDLVIPPDIKVLDDAEQVVVSVAHKKTIEEAVAAPEGAEEGVEPEVIMEKKPEEEGEGEAAADEGKPAKEEKGK